MKEIRIIVATPRPVQRARLAKALATHPMLTVIGQASDLSETYTMAEKLQPDVVLVAEEYSHVPEFGCMKSQFAALRAAWLVIGQPEGADDGVRRKPPTGPAIDARMTLQDILVQIEIALAARGEARPRVQNSAKAQPSRPRPERVVLIGASTGGVDALLTVLASFPVDCPPTAIVQHTGRGFSDSLIALLGRRCAARVVAAEDGLTLQSGMICVAGGTAGHLRLLGSGTLHCTVSPGEPVSGHIPSVDELFRSALPMADRVVAALLTGMGRDGAEGLLALRHKGATTLGQDEASAVVYGMPRAAFEMGAVQTQLGLSRIGPEILRHCHLEPHLAAKRAAR